MIAQLTTHLWQSTFFALAAGLLTVAFRRNRAQVRYWLWLSASLKFFIPFSLLMSLGSRMEWAPSAHRIATEIATPAVSYTIEQFSQPLYFESSPSPVAFHWTPLILTVWLCGFAAIALMRSRSWLRIRAAVHTSTPIDVAAPVEVRSSPGLLEPGVVGLFRPILLLPEGIADRLTPSELKAVLAHELCHVRRRDNILATLHMLVEATFWFHPLVWWIGARLVEERERACDEEVVTLGNDPGVYADAILNVCKLYAESPLACVSGVTGASIKRRIKTIMTNPVGQSLTHAKKTLLVVAGIGALAGPIVIGLLLGLGNAPTIQAQSPPQATAPPVAITPRLKFDAASIRPCSQSDEASMGRGGRGGGGGGGAPRTSSGRLRITCRSVSDLINTAYVRFGDDPPINVADGPFGKQEDGRIRGGPSWVNSDRYTVEAETDDPVANGPIDPAGTPALRALNGPMLRTLLEDRFRLKIHVEAEDVPMYALTVAPSGFKPKPVEAGDCLSGEEFGRSLDPGKPLKYDPTAKPVCAGGIILANEGKRTIQMNGPLSRLATLLQLDRQVIDRTGIAGNFNISIEFANNPGPAAPGNGDPPTPNDTPDVLGPSIFTVLEKQLGLKLEPVKAPRGHIVIDSIERPSEN